MTLKQRNSTTHPWSNIPQGQKEPKIRKQIVFSNHTVGGSTDNL